MRGTPPEVTMLAEVIESHSAIFSINPGPGYDTLLLRMIPGDLLSAFPHR